VNELEKEREKLREAIKFVAARKELAAQADAAEAKFQAAHARAEKQLANNRRIFYDR
jgi:hypothetical protein